jgi:hypothetical protein
MIHTALRRYSTVFVWPGLAWSVGCLFDKRMQITMSFLGLHCTGGLPPFPLCHQQRPDRQMKNKWTDRRRRARARERDKRNIVNIFPAPASFVLLDMHIHILLSILYVLDIASIYMFATTLLHGWLDATEGKRITTRSPEPPSLSCSLTHSLTHSRTCTRSSQLLLMGTRASHSLTP